jgi:two-component system copper resistance phosphate regulon response regulator CusR
MALLVIEENPELGSLVGRCLAADGHEVRQVRDVGQALSLVAHHRFDLILLDWTLPCGGALQVLQVLRGRSDLTPVLMLIPGSPIADRVAALDAGADDCLVQPFAVAEFLARVRALLRRTKRLSGSASRTQELNLLASSRSVERSGQNIQLTAREFDLLRFLLEHQEQVVTRPQIAEAVWGDRSTVSNVVDVYIRYLRAKVDEPFPSRLIQTVRGVGYILRSNPGFAAAGARG